MSISLPQLPSPRVLTSAVNLINERYHAVAVVDMLLAKFPELTREQARDVWIYAKSAILAGKELQAGLLTQPLDIEDIPINPGLSNAYAYTLLADCGPDESGLPNRFSTVINSDEQLQYGQLKDLVQQAIDTAGQVITPLGRTYPAPSFCRDLKVTVMYVQRRS